MNAKHSIYLFLALIATALAACSSVVDDDRYIFVASIDSLLPGGDSLTVVKHVLIEDFTGQRCVNCPEASALIHTMQETYGEENLIAVGIYSGPFGQTNSGRLDELTTETGNYYFDQLGVSSQPVARINRHGANLATATWSSAVLEYIQEEATLALDISSEYAAATREVSITVAGSAIAAVSGRLQVWLMENGIIDFQYLLDDVIEDEYEHNHVFRATVNDRDGDAYTLAAGASATSTFAYTLDDVWQAENMTVVAFVYTDGDVLQVTAAPVISTAQTEEEETND